MLRRRSPMPLLLVGLLVAPTWRGASADDPPKPDSYEVAAEHFRGERWNQAAAEFQKFLTAANEDPRAVWARYFLAESLLHENRAADAIPEFRRAAEAADDVELAASARFRLGEACFLAGRYADARRELKAFLESAEKHPAAARALYYLGEAAAAEKDDHAARQAFEALRTKHAEDPSASQAALVEICCLMRLGESQSAWDLLRPRYEKQAEPRDATIDYLAAALLVALGRDAEALAAYQAVADRKDDARRLNALAAIVEIHQRGDRPADAAAALRKIVREFPQDEAAIAAAFQLAELAAQADDCESAAARYAELAERSDLNSEQKATAWIGRVRALAQCRQWHDVIDVAKAAQAELVAAPRSYELDYLRGRAHFALAELAEARAAFADVIAAEEAEGTETEVLAQFMTAETHLLQRRYDEALVAYGLVQSDKYPHWRDAALAQAGKCREQLGVPAAPTAAAPTSTQVKR